MQASERAELVSLIREAVREILPSVLEKVATEMYGHVEQPPLSSPTQEAKPLAYARKRAPRPLEVEFPEEYARFKGLTHTCSECGLVGDVIVEFKIGRDKAGGLKRVNSQCRKCRNAWKPKWRRKRQEAWRVHGKT